jgi:HAD superfamily hydrolase (TIGR01484 family)
LTPLAEFDARAASRIHTLITDIDDTVTTEGLLTADAYMALERLQAAGLRLIVTTGRPAGWCDHIARMWPVDAVVGENGAVSYWYDRSRRVLASRHSLDEEGLRCNRDRVARVAEEVLRKVPGAALASDQFCRLYDLAIDYCEDVPRLCERDVDEIVRVMEGAGMTAKVSSIHVNGWFGHHDKLSMTRALVEELWGLDLDGGREGFAYAGDSPNDVPMFGHFPYSVGVANVREFAARMEVMPRFVTNARSGEGFAELAARLIALRGLS